jgi:hypothetical protein
MNALERIARVLREEGGLLGATVPDEPGVLDDAYGRLAADGPRPVDPAAAAFAFEAVREGYLLHYGPAARIVETEDADLALLAGDRLYALGLAALAEAGDLPAIAELADLIALCAQAHAADDRDLAEALWTAACSAVAHGTSEGHEAAKAAARGARPSAASALRAAARHLVPQQSHQGRTASTL